METITLRGTHTGVGGRPESGTVEIAAGVPAVDSTPSLVSVTRLPQVAVLDETGSWSLDVRPSDDPGWMIDGLMPLKITLRLTSGTFQGEYIITEAAGPVVDFAALQPLAVGVDVTPMPVPGPSAYDIAVAAGFSGSAEDWLASLEGPPGPPGTDGDDGADSTIPGPPNSLRIGTVSTLPAGSQATASITGTAPDQTLSLGVPTGATGTPGDLTQAIADNRYAQLRYMGNLLTMNQSQCGDDGTTTGMLPEYGTLRSVDVQPATGARCTEHTCTAAGTAAVMFAAAVNTASYLPVVPGEVITAVVSMRSDAMTNLAAAELYWRGPTGGLVGSKFLQFKNLSPAWQEFWVSDIAPENAAYVFLKARVNSASPGGVFYIDRAGVWRGTGGQWKPPGVPIPGIGNSWPVAGVLANAGSPGYYSLLVDSGHEPVGLSHVETFNDKVRVHYARPAWKVGGLIVAGDENTSAQYLFGASVGLTFADVTIRRRDSGTLVNPTTMPGGSANIWINGTML